jgi:MFS family permease
MIYALLAWPIGALSDRIGRRAVLLCAYASFVAIYALFASGATRGTVIVGFALLGVHSAMLEGSQRSMIADLVPAERRATAYGIYYAVVGLALLPASIGAGLLWDRAGAAATFAVDAALALVAALLSLILLPRRDERRDRAIA